MIKIGWLDEVDVFELVDNVVKFVLFGFKVGMLMMCDYFGLLDFDFDEELLGILVRD